MNIERDGIIRNFSSYETFQLDEKRLNKENRRNVIEAGNFLNSSGIDNSIIDFRQGFLGEMGNLTNEIQYGNIKNEFNVSIVLDWIDPDELKHLIIKVSVGYSGNNEKYMSASFREIPHYKFKKYDNLIHEIYLFHFVKEFDFANPVSDGEKKRYIEWLRGKVLNYKLIWGDV